MNKRSFAAIILTVAIIFTGIFVSCGGNDNEPSAESTTGESNLISSELLEQITDPADYENSETEEVVSSDISEADEPSDTVIEETTAPVEPEETTVPNISEETEPEETSTSSDITSEEMTTPSEPEETESENTEASTDTITEETTAPSVSDETEPDETGTSTDVTAEETTTPNEPEETEPEETGASTDVTTEETTAPSIPEKTEPEETEASTDSVTEETTVPTEPESSVTEADEETSAPDDTDSEVLSFSVICVEGSAGCYSFVGNTLTFSTLSANSVYAISGELDGNIVIDVGDDYKFELEMCGFTVRCAETEPISIISGDKVTLTAKKEYENFVYDLREAVADDDETQHSSAVYSTVDLVIGGKGALTVESENNNGIHTKDDLEVKNLTLSVRCVDNALKGNDSVTVISGNITLIATAGDGIKTSNTDISSKGNQRGTVTISGGTVNIYAACDGIDAAYDVVIDESESTVVLNIFTDKYSEYSEEVTVVSENTRYIRFTSKNYNYSVKYYNSASGEYKWVNAEYYTSVSGGRSTYYYYTVPIESGYDKFVFYMYSSSQAQGQDSNYTVCSELLTWNDSCDTFALSQSGSSLKYSWTNFTTSSGMGGMGSMGGMQEGNSDKGDYSTKGIKAGNAVTVSAGTVNIKAYDDAIHANSDSTLENGETPTGDVTISGGMLTVYSNDDGIHADGTLTVSGGNISVTNSYEGLEGTYIRITDGSVSVISSDDGMNATVETGTGITISGGTVYVYAKGDGLDSNSRSSYSGIVFSGGNTVVICNSSGNSAIDTEAGYKYTGGSVVAVTPSGGMSGESKMCSNFSSIATSKTLNLSSGSYLTVSSGGKTAVSVKMPCSMSSAMAIYLGSNSASITSSSSTSSVTDSNGVCWN